MRAEKQDILKRINYIEGHLIPFRNLTSNIEMGKVR